MAKYTILRIYEEDHGCEGIQPGEEPMDEVLLRDENGKEVWKKLPDLWLLQNGLDEGDTVELDT
ncbi:MAG: hypothetical protein IKN55_10765 [Oscillospiraceae bacterium]|nr:hypothetical protein [Oscillospiraceae bacterium]